MNERSIIDIERHFADEGERILSVLVIENPHVSCNQPAKRIEREPANGGFDATLVQFLNDAITPLSAEASFPQIPTAAEHAQDCCQNCQPHHSRGDAAYPRRLSILQGGFRGFWRWSENGGPERCLDC